MENIHRIEHLEVMPLTVLTIKDLESLEPYISSPPFHIHLNKWRQWQDVAKGNNKLPFSAYLYSLLVQNPPEDTFYDRKFGQLHSEMMTFFIEKGLK